MLQDQYGLQKKYIPSSIFPRASFRRIRNNVVSRRTSYSRQGFCWRARRVLLKLLLVQTLFTYREVIFPMPFDYKN